MDVAPRVLTTLPVITVLAAMTACGGTSSVPGFDDAGSSSSGSGSSSSGGSAGSSGSNAPGAGSGGATFSGSSGAAPAQQCSALGSTRSCCTTGTETCTGGAEFPSWGPCLDSKGAPLSCPVGCAPGETGSGCDGGVDAGPPPPPPPPPAVCTDPAVSDEPEILVGYSPDVGQTVGLHGQIKVWVNDENPPFIAPGEMVDNTTGAITAPGNRTATASDGLLYEPALYIAPQTPTNGGTPHFPQWVKGSYNNNPPTRGTFTGGAPIDPLPPGSMLGAVYTGEFIWDLSTLGLRPGSYVAVFSVHDGDHDRAIGCVNVVITP
jgi:hypothetical protein